MLDMLLVFGAQHMKTLLDQARVALSLLKLLKERDQLTAISAATKWLS